MKLFSNNCSRFLQTVPFFFLMLICFFSSSVGAAELNFSFAASGNEYATISADQDLEFTSFKVHNPYRLVVDIKNISSQATEYLSKNEYIAKVTVRGAGSGTRIVIEPTGNVSLVLKQVSKNSLAVIGVPEVQKNTPILSSAPPVSTTAPTATVSATSLIIKDNSILIGTSGFVDNVSSFTFPDSDRLVFVLKDTALSFKEGRYPLGFLNLSHMEVEKEGPNTKLTFTVKKKQPIPNYLSTKDNNAVAIRFFVMEESPGVAPTTTATPKAITRSSEQDVNKKTAKFTGQKISLDFDNAELKQIFRLLSEVNKKNYVLSDEVKGTLSIKLMNVPWDQAYDLILRVNNLAAIEEGNIVEVVTYNQKLERIKKQLEIDEFNKSQETLGLCTVQLRHASAQKVASAATTILKNTIKTPTREEVAKVQAKTGTGSYAGANTEPKTDGRPTGDMEQRNAVATPAPEFNNIYAEPNSNRLIIRDLPSKFPEVLKLLSILDVPDQQVMIEARIVQATTAFTKSLGVQWGVHYRDGSASFMGINSLNTGFGGLIDRVAPESGMPDPSQAGLGTGISFGTLTSNINLDLRLSAAADMNMAKVISTPRIATTYGETANIKDGTQYPYAKTDGLSGQVTYEFRDAVLSLDVTPTITPACDVIMKVEVTNDSLGAPINGQVPINKKTAKTTLSIQNGETAVIGGTFINDETEGESGVPYLMDIPLFGRLFKSKLTEKRQRELLIFLTPRLLNNNCHDSDVMKLKYEKLECSPI